MISLFLVGFILAAGSLLLADRAGKGFADRGPQAKFYHLWSMLWLCVTMAVGLWLMADSLWPMVFSHWLQLPLF